MRYMAGNLGTDPISTEACVELLGWEEIQTPVLL